MTRRSRKSKQSAVKLKIQQQRRALTNVLDDSDSASAPTTFNKFPILPVELKEKVYEYAAIEYDKNALSFRPPRFNENTKKPDLPAFCFTNKVEYRISAESLVRSLGLTFVNEHDADMAERWLESISRPNSNGLAMLKEAHIWYSSGRRGPSFAKEIQFFSRCPTLRHIEIITFPEDWERIPDERDYSRFRCAKDHELTGSALVHRFGLDHLQSCSALQSVMFRGVQFFLREDRLERANLYVDRAAKWLKDDFMASQGRVLYVELECCSKRGRDWIEAIMSMGNGSA